MLLLVLYCVEHLYFAGEYPHFFIDLNSFDSDIVRVHGFAVPSVCFFSGLRYSGVLYCCVKQLDDERESAKDAAFAQQLDDEFDDLDEVFLKEYRLKRLEELRKAYEAV